jgi:hypothetical protein
MYILGVQHRGLTILDEKDQVDKITALGTQAYLGSNSKQQISYKNLLNK